MNTKQSAAKPYMKDAIAIAAMIVLYNVCIFIAYDTLRYINEYKVIWALMGGVVVFVPMYAILWITLRKIKSQMLFCAVSWIAWAIYPLILLLNNNPDSNLTYKIGGKAVYLEGDLTLYGFFYKLQNPFFFLALYATAILFSNAYKNVTNKLGGV